VQETPATLKAAQMGNVQGVMSDTRGNAAADSPHELLQTEAAHLRRELSCRNALLAAQDAILLMQQQKLMQTETKSTTAALAGVQRQCLDSSQPPLEKDATLQCIFTLVGRQSYIYLAQVNRKWRGSYISFCGNKRVTHWKAAITSAQRLMMGFCLGLSLKMCNKTWVFSTAVMQRSTDPVRVLQMCKAKGMLWDLNVTDAVAAYGHLEYLQQMIALDCPLRILRLAASCTRRPFSVAVPMLQWLQSKYDWAAARDKQHVLREAGLWGSIETMAWLRAEHKVPWPTQFGGIRVGCGTVDHNSPPVKGARLCWDLTAIKWGFANGCGWGDWRCQHYDAGWYDDEDVENAEEVLAWAHEQEGCPCTCEDDSDADPINEANQN
jgi:hypothetical protein